MTLGKAAQANHRGPSFEDPIFIPKCLLEHKQQAYDSYLKVLFSCVTKDFFLGYVFLLQK